eukprot:8515106-Pyramimonas_sp.AAC.1
MHSLAMPWWGWHKGGCIALSPPTIDKARYLSSLLLASYTFTHSLGLLGLLPWTRRHRRQVGVACVGSLERASFGLAVARVAHPAQQGGRERQRRP